MMKKMLLRLLVMVLGATAFWGPVTLGTLLTGKGHGPLLGTVLSLGPFVGCYFLLRRKYAHVMRSISWWMVSGAVLLGGVFSSIAFTAMGAGFAGLHGWETVRWLLISLIPLWIALFGSLALGTFLAIPLVTLFAVIINAKLERGRGPKDSSTT